MINRAAPEVFVMTHDIDLVFCSKMAKQIKPKYELYKRSLPTADKIDTASSAVLFQSKQRLAAILADIYLVFREMGVQNAIITTLKVIEPEQAISHLFFMPAAYAGDSPILGDMLEVLDRRRLPVTRDELICFGTRLDECRRTEGIFDDLLDKAFVN